MISDRCYYRYGKIGKYYFVFQFKKKKEKLYRKANWFLGTKIKIFEVQYKVMNIQDIKDTMNIQRTAIKRFKKKYCVIYTIFI